MTPLPLFLFLNDSQVQYSWWLLRTTSHEFFLVNIKTEDFNSLSSKWQSSRQPQQITIPIIKLVSSSIVLQMTIVIPEIYLSSVSPLQSELTSTHQCTYPVGLLETGKMHCHYSCCWPHICVVQECKEPVEGIECKQGCFCKNSFQAFVRLQVAHDPDKEKIAEQRKHHIDGSQKCWGAEIQKWWR